MKIFTFCLIITLLTMSYSCYFDKTIAPNEYSSELGISRPYKNYIRISVPGSPYDILKYDVKQNSDTLHISVSLIGRNGSYVNIPIDSTIRYIDYQNNDILKVDSIKGAYYYDVLKLK